MKHEQWRMKIEERRKKNERKKKQEERRRKGKEKKEAREKEGISLSYFTKQPFLFSTREVVAEPNFFIQIYALDRTLKVCKIHRSWYL